MLKMTKNLNQELNKRFCEILIKNPQWGEFSVKKVPENFKWVIEFKCGYNDIDLVSDFDKGNAQLNDWMHQVSKDAERCGRKPLIVWKKDYKPRVAFIKQDDFIWMLSKKPNPFQYKFEYKEWIGLSYDVLMTFPDSIFFNI